MMEQDQNLQLFKYVFPTIYGEGQKSDQVASKLFNKVIEFVRTDNQYFSKAADRQTILDRLTKASPQSIEGTTQVIFQCSYACSIVIQKVKRQSPIDIYIVTPEQWASGLHSWKEECFQYCEPKDKSYYFLPRIAEHQTSLQQFVPVFKNLLENELVRIQQQMGQQKKTFAYTANSIKQACKMAASNSKFSTHYNDYRSSDDANNQQQNRVFRTQMHNIQMNNSKTNTSWYVPSATLDYLISSQFNPPNRPLTEKLIIGFKGYLLQQITHQRANQSLYNQLEVLNFKRCLDELIFRYKKNISTYDKKTINRESDFKKFIEKINNHLKVITNNGLTSKIDDIAQNAQDLRFENPKRAMILQPQKQQHLAEQIKHVQILQHRLRVDNRLPFQELLQIGQKVQQKDLEQKDKWILLTQKFLFSITQNFANNDTIIDLHIHMRQIECQIGASNLCLVIQKYEKIIQSNQSHFGMGMISQVRSHIQLIKAIGTVIAFESVKMNRYKKKSNLNEYCVPVDINGLYKNFVSQSYEGRKAMKNLNIYNQNRQQKKPIFVLDGTSNSFQQFARLAAQQTRSAKVWIDNFKYQKYYYQQYVCKDVQLAEANRRLQRALHYLQNSINGAYRTYGPAIQQLTFDVNIPPVLLGFNEDDPWLFAFLQNIQSDVMGMIKMLYYAQNPTIKDHKPQNKQNNLFQEHFVDQQFSIKILSQKPNPPMVPINSANAGNIENIPCVRLFKDVKIVFNDSTKGNPLNPKNFENYKTLFFSNQRNKQFRGKLQYILSSPKDDTVANRQHRLYAKQFDRPQQIQIQHFLAIGNIRSAQNTQMMILCYNILQKKIASNSFNKDCILGEETILQTTGRLICYQPNIQNQFKQIRQLLTRFLDGWAFADVNFCPIIGPFFGYIGRQLIEDRIPNQQQIKQIRKSTFQLCKKCINQYENGQKQLKIKPHTKIQWYQRYVITAALTCLRQTILTRQDEDQIVMLCQLIFSLRSSQILSGRQSKPQNTRQFQKDLSFGISKTIFYNIEVISNLLQTKPGYIGQIVKKMDPSYPDPDNVVWTKDNLFSFSGKSQQSADIYQIDLFTGKIFKNGKQISALDPQIKQNPNFIDIFGKNRQFQVFQSHYPNFLRTKSIVNYQFKIPEQKGLIFFQFSQDGKEIRHIFKKKGSTSRQQQIWLLIPRQKLLASNCYFPRIFLDHYMAWYSQTRKCIIFRRNKFEDIYNAGIVIHLKNNDKDLLIDKALYITYHGSYQNQDLDILCDKESRKYDQIILRNKQVKLQDIRCFNLLSRFESPDFIFELRNKETKQIQYLLHRYQIKFLLENQNNQARLSSQTYFGYSLDYSFYENRRCLFNRFPCLVLQKHSNNPALLNNHKRIFILSDGQIQMGGKIKRSREADIHINSFKYQIHDFFGDLRGANRQSLLHLSALMLSINDNMKIASIQMTPLDYSIYLLNCCLSNRPYPKSDIDKMGKIIRNLNPPESFVLLLECLWTCSKALSDILPFSKQKSNCIFYSLHEQQLQTCRTLYSKNLGKQLVRYREKINFDLLKYLGLNVSQNKIYQVQSSSSSSSDNQQVVHRRQKIIKIYWKRSTQFTGDKFIVNFESIKTQFQRFKQTAAIICQIWKQQIKQKQLKKNELSPKIKEIGQKQNSNPMTKQMIGELQQSYDIFLKQQQRIAYIMNKINNNKIDQIATVSLLINQGTQLVQNIQDLINQIKQENQKHPDNITGIQPTLSFICFTQILCNKKHILQFFPWLSQTASSGLIQTIRIWIQLKTRLASFQRMNILLKSQHIDPISLMRQAQSPRDQVRKKHHWLCFEAENKVQLWSSQLDTYNNLTQSGDFCQLNMGEGKTQVIIPMMVLDSIYQKQNCLPRINLLNSLIDQARGNFFRFLSVTGFQIPGFEIPFTRQVELFKTRNKNSNILKVQDLVGSFSNRLYILMTRESRLSQILRYYEVNKEQKQISMKKQPLIPQKLKIYDIFDEIDQLMNPIKSYIFSIGKTYDLPQQKQRFEILRVLIQVFLKKHLKRLMLENMVISEQTFDQTISFAKQGNYPPGLRLNIEHSNRQVIMNLKKKLAKHVIKHLKNGYFSFYKKLNLQQKNQVLEFIINPLNQKNTFPKYIENTWKTQILVLRGALGYGIFEHCLSMRCGVDYGVPNKLHKKKIAVPYDAADIPSKTSQYQHPDVSILLSYFAYYTKGLTFEQFQKAIERLLTLSRTSKLLQYEQWFKSLSFKSQQKNKIKNALQININSKVVIDGLYTIFRRNRKTISFWLNLCVFPSNLRQYKSSITASAWDFADVKHCVGFSGTKDNHWLYSDKLKWKPCKTPAISGTDGKMIHLISKNTTKICLIKQNDKNQWQRFIDSALHQKVECIIDAGALCVGKSLQRQIVPWIAQHQSFDHKRFVGVSFCDENGKWKVYDIESRHYIPRGTSIPDHQTFVIFDEARTRGADLKMSSDITAAISLGPHMTKDKFMQAAGRLRRLGRDQKLKIMATQEIFSSLPQLQKIQNLDERIQNLDAQQLTNSILAWCCNNSIELNQRLLIQYANLGWDYIRSKEDQDVYIKELRSSLEDMYENCLEKTTVAKLNEKKVKKIEQKYVNTQSGIEINRVLNLYGQNVQRQASNFDDVCQRQVQPEPQVQKQQQDSVQDLDPIPEKEDAPQLKDIKDIAVVFDEKFKLSQNFVRTTKQLGVSNLVENPKIRELGELYFVLYGANFIKAITLRQASKFIYKKYVSRQMEENRDLKIQFLSNLSIEDDFIKQNNLQAALINAKYVSGVENYTLEEQQHLLRMFLDTLKENKKWRQNYEKLTSIMLSKKRIYYKRFFGSTLQTIVTRLKNEDVEGRFIENNTSDQKQQLFDSDSDTCNSSDGQVDDKKEEQNKYKMIGQDGQQRIVFDERDPLRS